MKSAFLLLLVATLATGCGNAGQTADNQSLSRQSPIKVDLVKNPDERIKLTAMDNNVTIENVTANRGNCSLITGDTGVGVQYFMVAQVKLQEILPTLNIDPKELAEADADTEKGFRLMTKYVKDPPPPFPKFPQQLQFGEVFQLGYMCQRVIEVIVDTNRGSWTFTWE